MTHRGTDQRPPGRSASTTRHGRALRAIALGTAAALTALSWGALAQAPRREPTISNLAALLEAAERHFATLRAADHAIEAAEARLDEIRLSPFFQFAITGGMAISPGASGTPIYSPDGQLPLGNRWGPVFSVEVEGAVPIYTFGKIVNARRAGRAGVRAAEHERTRTLAGLRFDIRRAYFALQLALDVQQMISEGRRHLRRAVATLEEREEEMEYGGGDGEDVNPMDGYRLAAALAEVESRASEVIMLENASRAALETLSGITPVRIPDCPIARVPLNIAEVEEYVSRAHSYRPELGMLEAAQDARRAQLAIHRARYFPDLALALRAGYSWGGHVTDIQNPFIRDRANNRALGAALVFRWNLDFAGTFHRARRAEAQLAELEAQDEAARDGIRLEVIAAYEALRDADRREEAWAEGERMTRRWFVATAQGYQVGATESKDLIDAMKAYFTNRFAHLDATREFNTAAARLERVTGRELVPSDRWETSCREPTAASEPSEAPDGE